MSIFSSRNLLGCHTLRDWFSVRAETDLLDTVPEISSERKNMLLKFALQGAAPFCVCVVSYKNQILILNGASELRALLDFVTCILSSKSKDIDITHFCGLARERVLDMRIPHCDFTVDSQEEFDMLKKYYELN